MTAFEQPFSLFRPKLIATMGAWSACVVLGAVLMTVGVPPQVVLPGIVIVLPLALIAALSRLGRGEKAEERAIVAMETATFIAHQQDDMLMRLETENAERLALALIEAARSLAKTAPEEAKRKLETATNLVPTPRVRAAADVAWSEINNLYGVAMR